MSVLDQLEANETLRREGVGLIVEGALRRPLREYVDVAGLVELASLALHQAPIARGLADHARPGIVRFYERMTNDDVPVGAFVPEPVRERLIDLAGATALPRFKWAKDTVDPALFRQLFAPSLQEWLMQFLGRLPGVGGLAGAFAKRMGGGGMTEKLSSLAGDFSRSTTGALRDAVAKRLDSEEGQKILAEIRRQAFERTLDVPVTAILDDLAPLPWDELQAIAPEIVEGVIRSELAQTILRDELEAFLAVEGDKPVRALLEEAGVLPQVRAYLRVQGEGLLAGLLKDDAFREWLAKL